MLDQDYNHFQIIERALVRDVKEKLIKEKLIKEITEKLVKEIVVPEVEKVVNQIDIKATMYDNADKFIREVKVYCEFKKEEGK